ncbi:hypothetical protein [Nigerium massiliense]|uniref:hypothetical protein n=1 Tax=Nigerium massiliense TaxID=1522317 RepID=UPI00058B80E2|nr:hypothetical protein [Nigerium massiliense]
MRVRETAAAAVLGLALVAGLPALAQADGGLSVSVAQPSSPDAKARVTLSTSLDLPVEVDFSTPGGTTGSLVVTKAAPRTISIPVVRCSTPVLTISGREVSGAEGAASGGRTFRVTKQLQGFCQSEVSPSASRPPLSRPTVTASGTVTARGQLELPGRDVNVQLPGRDVNVQWPGRDVNVELPGRDVNVELPGRDVNVELPGRDVSVQLPRADVSVQLPRHTVELPEPRVTVTRAGVAPAARAAGNETQQLDTRTTDPSSTATEEPASPSASSSATPVPPREDASDGTRSSLPLWAWVGVFLTLAAAGTVVFGGSRPPRARA